MYEFITLRYYDIVIVIFFHSIQCNLPYHPRLVDVFEIDSPVCFQFYCFNSIKGKLNLL